MFDKINTVMEAITGYHSTNLKRPLPDRDVANAAAGFDHYGILNQDAPSKTCPELDGIWVVDASLSALGMDPCPTVDYPQELSNFLRRKVECITLGEAKKRSGRFFMKPNRKGRVEPCIIEGPYNIDLPDLDHYGLESLDDDYTVYVSDVIDLVSEWRCFVCHGDLLDARPYAGDSFIIPVKSIVEEAIRTWTTQPVSYSLDFGVLESGETVLIEVNGGLSLGGFGLDPAYAAYMKSAQWLDLAHYFDEKTNQQLRRIK